MGKLALHTPGSSRLARKDWGDSEIAHPAGRCLSLCATRWTCLPSVRIAQLGQIMHVRTPSKIKVNDRSQTHRAQRITMHRYDRAPSSMWFFTL